MARYLSPEWVQSFDAALSALDLTDAVAAAAAGSLAAADGAFSVAQLVSGVPPELALGGDAAAAGDTREVGDEDGEPAVGIVLSVAEGRAHLTLDRDGVLTARATATIALGYADALALALGRLDAADALAAGRVRVRGDLAALVAGQELLAAAATRLGSALDDLTDPIDDGASGS